MRIATLVFVGALGAASWGQVDGLTWVPYPSGPGGTTLVALFDAAGTAVNGFTVPGTSVALSKAASGWVWILTGSWLRPHTAAGPAGAPIPVVAPGAVAVTSSGEVWTTAPGSSFVPGTLQRRDAVGMVIQNFGTAIATSLGLKADPFGNVWLLSDATNLVHKYTPNNTAFGYVTGSAGSVPLDWALDSLGSAWILSTSTSSQVELDRLDNAGNVTLSTVITSSSPVGIAVDGCDQAWVLRTSAGAQQDLALFDGGGNVVATVPLPSIAPNTRGLVAIDIAGRFVLSNTANPGLEVFDRGGNLVASLAAPQGSPLTEAGDLTGLELLAVVDRGGDGDQDGVTNGVEFQIGSDPTSAASPVQLSLTGLPIPGSTVGIGLAAPAEPGFPYLIGAATATTGISLFPGARCPQVPLALDPLLAFWFSPANTLATNITGQLDLAGSASATLVIPPDPALSGALFFLAGLTVDPATAQLSTITAPLAVAIL